jgi:AICAR transformylase/IMP cyclohydrolase PurH
VDEETANVLKTEVSDGIIAPGFAYEGVYIHITLSKDSMKRLLKY